jgi:signal transduction histidine kinase
VDERGQAVSLPEPGSGRTVTVLADQGEPIGALIHEPTALEDAALLGEVAAAAKIALANVRLEAQVGRHLADLEASRRRIMEATDAERRRLQTLLRLRVGPELSELGGVLDRGYEEAQACDNLAAAAALKAARDGLDEAEQGVQFLAAGIHPVVLEEQGIGPALSALVARSGVPARVTVPSVRLPGEVEVAIYFVCSEALTNVRKHARASRVDLDLRVEDESAVVVVGDDGVGGADPSSGSGLKGLRDRVAAFGGVLSIDSPPGLGTRIVAVIPLEGHNESRTPTA